MCTFIIRSERGKNHFNIFVPALCSRARLHGKIRRGHVSVKEGLAGTPKSEVTRDYTERLV